MCFAWDILSACLEVSLYNTYFMTFINHHHNIILFINDIIRSSDFDIKNSYMRIVHHLDFKYHLFNLRYKLM